MAAFPLLAVILTGCGAGDDDTSPAIIGPSSTETIPGQSGLPAWVDESLRSEAGADVALVLGSLDFAVGENRVSFLVVRNDGELVQAPTASVRYGAPDADAVAQTEATLVPLGPHSHPEGAEAHDHAEATDLYVAHLETARPGRYWLVVDPQGQSIQGVGSIDVRERTISPPVGTKAPPSDTPTLADGPAEELTTAKPPDVELLRYSIADSLADGVPFVAVFATPAYCRSRTCGPTVEVVQEVAKAREGSSIRFIHVEIYEDNDPQKGFNRWVREWRLPSEPWVFLVDGEGIIQAKFEGSVSVSELEDAVRQHLPPSPPGG